MKTARELIGELVNVNYALTNESYEKESMENDQRLEELSIKQHNIESEIKDKVKNIDSFMLDLNRREHVVDANIEAMKEEIDRLQARKKALEQSKKFFNKFLLPIIIKEAGDENGVYETDTARYKLYQTWGPLELTGDQIDDQYMYTRTSEVIDRQKARADAIAASEKGEDLPTGFKIKKVDRIRRS